MIYLTRCAPHAIEPDLRFDLTNEIQFTSLEGLLGSVGERRGAYCTSCYTGEYPVAFPQDEASYLQLALKLSK